MRDLEPYREPDRKDDPRDRAGAGERQDTVFNFRAYGPGRLLGLLVPAGCAGVLLLVGLVFVFVLFVFKFLWAWTVPDLFPGAVAQGLVARELSWGAAFKLACVSAVVSGFFRRR
ncbi:MAG: hypothetical protein AAB152_14620 [Candidatus Coatesbacteria bacterium]